MNSPLASVEIISPHTYGLRSGPLERLTVHCFVAQVTAKRGCEVFLSDRKASANYVIGKDGDIGVSVPEDKGAMTSSNRDNDMKAVTIEVASDTKAPYAVTAKAWAALVDLCADICRRNGKRRLVWLREKEKTLSYKPEPGDMVLTVHRWFANKACPGDYLFERLGQLAIEVNTALNAAADEPSAYARGPWEWATSLGITDGSNPKGPATREQVICMLSRMYDKMKGAT